MNGRQLNRSDSMEDKNFDVFISYSRSDLAKVKPIKEELESQGFSCWMDIEGIESGEPDFKSTIVPVLDNCGVVLFFISKDSQKSQWTTKELNYANRHKKRIVPLRFNDDELGGEFEFDYGGADTIDWRFSEQREKLLRNLRQWAERNWEIAPSVTQVMSSIEPTLKSGFFVGRDNELSELNKLLVSGKFPVVTGPGGIGKSELVRQYAARYGNDYPGGLFLLDLATSSTWDSALENKLFSLSYAPGAEVCDPLCLKGETIQQSEEPRRQMTDATGQNGKTGRFPSARAIVSLLNDRAKQKNGPLLLILDNVQSVKAFLGEKTLGMLALHSNVRLLATSRVTDILIRATGRCVEFPLRDLSSDAALALLPQNGEAASSDELSATRDIAERLGNRVLYIRAIRMLFDGLYSPCCGSYSRMAKTLRDDLLATVDLAMKESEDPWRTPSALWAETSKALSEQSGGEAYVKLAQLASFSSSDGTPRHVLLHLWKDLVQPTDTRGPSFDQAVLVLRQHGLLCAKDENIREEALFMPRLTSAAVAKSAIGEMPEIEDDIGNSLARYSGMSKDNWMLFSDNMRIVRHVPETMLDGDLSVRILLHNVEFAEFCNWMKLNGNDWAMLLCYQPQFEEMCSWEKLEGSDWARLLGRQPQFEDKCKWEKLKGRDWVRLLGLQPQFAEKCSWEKLEGSDWVRLLSNQPQFADKCPWDKLEGRDWVWLLRVQPQFADKCKWEQLKIQDWARILSAVPEPQYAVKCPWEKFDGNDWASLLGSQPQFSVLCTWENFSGNDWASLIRDQPQFADKCPWEKLCGGDWASLLSDKPQFADKCPWNKLEGSDWVWLLRDQPQFADKCPWDKLGGDNWASLLSDQAQLADKCPWEKLEGGDWTSLLGNQPKFADKCPWEKLEGGDWAALLGNQPQFADKCPWEEFKSGDWVWLLRDQPQYAEKCPWKEFTGGDWAWLISRLPEFADKCLWEKLEGDDWAWLLRRQPQFSDKCPWEKLGGGNWASLLGRQPQFADKCPWKKLEGGDWALLLGDQPRFADRCPWEKFKGDDWALLLRDQPQFADKCPWDKLEGGDWAALLGRQPQFADKCPWNKLEGSDWASLLGRQPQFADKCPWDKLENRDWKRLLPWQPRFADKCPRDKLEGGVMAKSLGEYSFSDELPPPPREISL